MKIIRGFVAAVLPMGTEEKPWSLVCISEVTKTRHGLDESTIAEFMVAGKQYKEGLQNVYRKLEGAEVFAPISPYIDTYSGKPEIKYRLEGVPIRLQESAPVSAAPASRATA